jgi:hypothetical protein
VRGPAALAMRKRKSINYLQKRPERFFKNK